MPRSAAGVSVVLWLGLLLVGSAAAQTGPESGSPFDGRWVIAGDPWFSEISTGRGGRQGGRAGAQPADPDVILRLKVTPDGTITGLATGVGGRRGAPGSHPAHRVEITRGALALSGDLLRFEIWRFDGYHNRLHVEARAEGDGLVLDFRREAPDGPVTFTTRASRAEY